MLSGQAETTETGMVRSLSHFWGRMKILHILGSLVMLIVAALGMLAALHIVLELPVWTLSKAAEWTAAIGTVGTLAASLWLATTETRRRRKDAIERAHIVASALAPRLSLFRRDISGAAGCLVFTNLDVGHRATPRQEAAAFLQSHWKDVTTEELLVLTALDGGLANKLAYAQSQAQIIRKLIEDEVAAWEELQPESPLDEQTAVQWHDMLRDLSERFWVIERRFVSIARQHARGPDGEELYG